MRCELSGRNGREPWIYRCALSFFFSLKYGQGSRKLISCYTRGDNLPDELQELTSLSLPIQRDCREIICYLKYNIASICHLMPARTWPWHTCTRTHWVGWCFLTYCMLGHNLLFAVLKINPLRALAPGLIGFVNIEFLTGTCKENPLCCHWFFFYVMYSQVRKRVSILEWSSS